MPWETTLQRTRLVPGALIALSAAGLAVSAYLSAAHFGGPPLTCGGIGGCDTVNSSRYAYFAGLPVALLGAFLYVTLMALAAAWVIRGWDERLMTAFWGLALAGALYALYLTYVELAIIDAVCVWCVTSALIVSACLGLSSWALLSAERPEAAPVQAPERRRGPAGAGSRQRSRT